MFWGVYYLSELLIFQINKNNYLRMKIFYTWMNTYSC
jgi:hypothetical protein